MRYRVYGKTGWKVSEVGFGAMELSVSPNPIQTLLTAWELGINFVDTAQAYGSGLSEAWIGRALKEWNGGHIYVATKVKPVEWPHPSDSDPSTERGQSALITNSVTTISGSTI